MRYVIAAIVLLLEIEAELILIDDPFAVLLHTHLNTSQRAVTLIDKAIVHFVGELHSSKFGVDLRACESLNIFCGNKVGIEGNGAPDACGECRYEMLHT